MAAAGTTTKLTPSSATTNRRSRSGSAICATVRPRPMAAMLPTTNTSIATCVTTSIVSESISDSSRRGRPTCSVAPAICGLESFVVLGEGQAGRFPGGDSFIEVRDVLVAQLLRVAPASAARAPVRQ